MWLPSHKKATGPSTYAFWIMKTKDMQFMMWIGLLSLTEMYDQHNDYPWTIFSLYEFGLYVENVIQK